jgi:alkanesulfonate monooxygenase SsuD/methylene tetrahydromethanopterin reductase-like flavin-dependent oxidoreductase (luciferase family)
LLLPLRPVALVAEETAWLDARFPGRVGIGVAAGALTVDFEIMDATTDDLARRFGAALSTLTAALRGEAEGTLACDAAIARTRARPIPVLSAAASKPAARRAAAARAGLLFDSLVTPDHVRGLVDEYRGAGGMQSCVLIRRVWVGDPPRADVERQVGVYRSYAPANAPARWGTDEMATGSADAIAKQLVEVAHQAGVDALNLRVHVPGVEVTAAREQIERIGTDVVPYVKEHL